MRMGKERTDQKWRRGEEILSLAKYTPSWLGSRDSNQSPAHLPPSSPQLPTQLLPSPLPLRGKSVLTVDR